MQGAGNGDGAGKMGLGNGLGFWGADASSALTADSKEAEQAPRVMHTSTSGAGKGAPLLSFAKLLVYFKASNSWSISCVMAQNNAVNSGVAAIAQRHQHWRRGRESSRTSG